MSSWVYVHRDMCPWANCPMGKYPGREGGGLSCHRNSHILCLDKLK